jgi:hypothetical protein
MRDTKEACVLSRMRDTKEACVLSRMRDIKVTARSIDSNLSET